MANLEGGSSRGWSNYGVTACDGYEHMWDPQTMLSTKDKDDLVCEMEALMNSDSSGDPETTSTDAVASDDEDNEATFECESKKITIPVPCLEKETLVLDLAKQQLPFIYEKMGVAFESPEIIRPVFYEDDHARLSARRGKEKRRGCKRLSDTKHTQNYKTLGELECDDDC